MWSLDASSIIHAWDTYPFGQFPPLWRWFEAKVQREQVGIAKPAQDEVAHKNPACGSYLKLCGIRLYDPTGEILQKAMEIKGVLGIVDDDYHPDGVGENDLLIIATACVNEFDLISNESPQIRQPRQNRKLKIPRVCQFPELNVRCIDFLEFLRQSKQVFE